MVILEVPVFSYESAIIAEKSGAGRIELCSSYIEGGITPSYGLIESVTNKLSIPVNIMVRPRGGDFLYSDYDFEVMKKDILFCKSCGVNGVVFGILDKSGNVDIEKCKILVDLAKPLSITFHRAFDRVCEPYKPLEDIISLGFNRILTSGLEKDAITGSKLISDLISFAGDKIIIMPGCGITSSNVSALLNIKGLKEIHASCKKISLSKMEYKSMSIGFNDNSNSQIVVDSEEIIKLLKVVC